MSGDSSGLQGVGLFASWELDLWGRVRAAARSSEFQYQSAQLDAEFARQSLAALVVKAWIVAVEARLQKAQAEASLASAEQLASLARDRLRVGIGDEYDVALAQANVESFRDTARNLDLAYQNALRALESLLGRYPAAAAAVAERLPAWPGEVPVGLPSDLLERRPDVIAAERRVAAAFYLTEEAKAARLPRITLVANYTSISSELFLLKPRDNPLFGAGAAAAADLLGGLLQARSRACRQQARSRLRRSRRRALAKKSKARARSGSTTAGSGNPRPLGTRERARSRSRHSPPSATDLSPSGSSSSRSTRRRWRSCSAVDRLVQRVNLHLALGDFDRRRRRRQDQRRLGRAALTSCNIAARRTRGTRRPFSAASKVRRTRQSKGWRKIATRGLGDGDVQTPFQASAMRFETARQYAHIPSMLLALCRVAIVAAVEGSLRARRRRPGCGHDRGPGHAGHGGLRGADASSQAVNIRLAYPASSTSAHMSKARSSRQDRSCSRWTKPFRRRWMPGGGAAAQSGSAQVARWPRRPSPSSRRMRCREGPRRRLASTNRRRRRSAGKGLEQASSSVVHDDHLSGRWRQQHAAVADGTYLNPQKRS